VNKKKKKLCQKDNKREGTKDQSSGT
jgi:hypothetical protein